MLIQFANTWLTNDGSGALPERAWTSTQDLKIDGKEVIQESKYVDAAVMDIFDRGNLGHTLSFAVTRDFQLMGLASQSLTLESGQTLVMASGATLQVGGVYLNNPVALASLFTLTHLAGLTKSGALVFTCGGWGETPAYARAASAVLESAPSTTRGVKVTTRYNFRFGSIGSFNPAVDVQLTTPAGVGMTTPDGVPLTLP